METAEAALGMFWIAVTFSALLTVAGAWAAMSLRMPEKRCWQFRVRSLMMMMALLVACISAVAGYVIQRIHDATTISHQEQQLLGTWVRDSSPLVLGRGELIFKGDRTVVATEWINSVATSTTYCWKLAGGQMYTTNEDKKRFIGILDVLLGVTPEHSWRRVDIRLLSSEKLKAGGLIYLRKTQRS